jgi:hypothetical protein
MSISSTTSITSKLGSAAAAITKVPEIEMEGFGLGL